MQNKKIKIFYFDIQCNFSNLTTPGVFILKRSQMPGPKCCFLRLILLFINLNPPLLILFYSSPFFPVLFSFLQFIPVFFSFTFLHLFLKSFLWTFSNPWQLWNLQSPFQNETSFTNPPHFLPSDSQFMFARAFSCENRSATYVRDWLKIRWHTITLNAFHIMLGLELKGKKKQRKCCKTHRLATSLIKTHFW